MENTELAVAGENLATHPPDWWVGELAVMSGPRTIRAANDLAAIQIFLAARRANKNTISSYLKETNRLLIWCQDVRGKPLSALGYDDILMFQAWLANPGPEFISPDRQLAGRGRLLFYKTGLSDASARASMRVVAALFNELEIGGYLAANPVRLYMRHQKGRGAPTVKRREPVPGDMLDAIDEWLGSLPGLNRDKGEYGALVAALLYMGLRASEAANAKLDGFHVEEASGQSAYGFTVTGKRGKTRVVPVEGRTREAFERYRRVLGFPDDLMSPNGGDTPLVGVISRSGVYSRVKSLCVMVAAWLVSNEDSRAAWFIDTSVFPHRFRHTATRRWLDAGVSLSAVQDNLGHSDINTTRIYDNGPIVNRLKEVSEKLDSRS